MTQTIEQLTARVRELEEENVRLEAECDDIKRIQLFVGKLESVTIGWKKQLAAEQLNNKLLRGALEAVIKVHGYKSGIPVEAISTQTSTEALDKYVAEKVEEMTIERCAEKLLSIGALGDGDFLAAIRALPTGQIKLEELL